MDFTLLCSVAEICHFLSLSVPPVSHGVPCSALCTRRAVPCSHCHTRRCYPVNPYGSCSPQPRVRPGGASIGARQNPSRVSAALRSAAQTGALDGTCLPASQLITWPNASRREPAVALMLLPCFVQGSALSHCPRLGDHRAQATAEPAPPHGPAASAAPLLPRLCGIL